MATDGRKDDSTQDHRNPWMGGLARCRGGYPHGAWVRAAAQVLHDAAAVGSQLLLDPSCNKWTWTLRLILADKGRQHLHY